jgi:hypothetical protein
VFLILLNVLIAIVCDNYDFALIKARELFLLSRLNLVAGLELQGFTRLRPAPSRVPSAAIRHGRHSTVFSQERRNSAARRDAQGSAGTQSRDSISTRLNGGLADFSMAPSSSIGNYVSYKLYGTPWHRLMRRLLAIHRTTALLGDDRDDEKGEWQGRVRHLEQQINAIVEGRVVASEERLLRALDMLATQQMELMEVMRKNQAACPERD